MLHLIRYIYIIKVSIMKNVLTILLFLLSLNLFAQAPWRAKLYVHFNLGFNQSITDTIWFGCDSLGNEGYQEGLDQLDTIFNENKVFFEDAIVKNQLGLNTPYNLNTSIKGFKNGEITFNVQTFGPTESLSWDTLDFFYDSSLYHLSSVFIKCFGCNLDAWEIEEFIIMGRHPNEPIQFSDYDSIGVLGGADARFNIVVKFRDTATGLTEKNGMANNVFIQNPVINDKLEVTFLQNKYNGVSIYNQLGQLVWQQTITQSKHVWDVSTLPNAIYFISFNDNTQQTKPIKLLKQ